VEPASVETNFSDLEGNLDAEPTFLDAQVNYATKDPQRAIEQDKCRACNGSGVFRSKFTGRVVGDCFRCHGTGRVSHGMNERVEKAKATKQANVQKEQDARNAYIEEHRAVIDYLRQREQRWDFARNCLERLANKGSMSEGQLNAAYNAMESDAARAKARAVEAAKAEPEGSGLDLSALPAGRYAVPDGDTRLKLLVKKPEAPGKWAGWVFVSDAAEYGQQQKYGRQAPGKTYSGKCVDQLRAILADPKAAVIAYGKLTGTCGVCGRKLENAESVAAGIGPICADGF